MEHEIRTILNGYAEAVWNKDSDAFLALYDKDLIDFDTWSEWSYNGKEAFSRMPLTWFKDLADDRVRVTFVNPTITTDGNLAAVWTEVIYAAYDQKDRLLRFMTNRLTWILHFKEGHWTILHEHTSIPVDDTTGQGLFKDDTTNPAPVKDIK